MAGAADSVISPYSMAPLFVGSMGSHLLDSKMIHAIRLSDLAIYQAEQEWKEQLQLVSKKRRRVHFNLVSCRMNVTESVLENPITQMDEDRWIEQDELRRIQKRQKYHALEIASTSPGYISSVLSLMETHKSLDENTKMNLKRHISIVAETDCRGLERHIVPKLNHLRRENIRITLSLQKQLRERGLLGTDSAREIIRKRCACASRPLRQLASHLAQADEWEAKQGSPFRLN